MDLEYKFHLDKAKRSYYKNEIAKLKKSNPKKWYYWLKRLVSSDQLGSHEINVQSLNNLPIADQAEKIADKMAAVRNEYEPLSSSDIILPKYNNEDIPIINVLTVEKLLSELKTNISTIKGDIEPKIIKRFSKQLSGPLTNIINSAITKGAWPNILKEEIVTPSPTTYPQKDIEDLRDITGLFTFNKIAGKVIGELMIQDMKTKLDPSQYANQKGIGIQHYLINMLNRVLVALDNNSRGEVKAVIATFVDWKQAFPRQCPRMGIDAFIACGVRPALIPLLISYFQDRKMRIKWKGIYSNQRDLNGGGPQGSLLSNLEYLAQSNDSADMVNIEDRFKLVDDLTALDIINLLITEISAYDLRSHVPSDIPLHNKYIKNENLQSQKNLSLINQWTKSKKMVLNKKKTKTMIFNFTHNFQFTTRMIEDNVNIEVVD